MPSVDWVGLIKGVPSVIDFLGDLVTVVLGTLTLYGVFKYRKKLSATFRMLRMEHISERRKEIAATLDRISGSIIKGKAMEARALFGALDGQLRSLCGMFPEFLELQKEVSAIAHNDAPLTEAIKQRLVYQINAEFESYKLNSMKDFGGEKS